MNSSTSSEDNVPLAELPAAQRLMSRQKKKCKSPKPANPPKPDRNRVSRLNFEGEGSRSVVLREIGATEVASAGDSDSSATEDVRDTPVSSGRLEFDLEAEVDSDGNAAGPTSVSKAENVKRLLKSRGFSGVKFVIPETNQRPWTPPRGYVCLYEAYFEKCHLWFPLPSLLLEYCARRRLAISQLSPAAICNVVAIAVLGAEAGFRVGPLFFEMLTDIKKTGRYAEYFVINMNPRFNVLLGGKDSKYEAWETKYFYVRVDEKSFELPSVRGLREWCQSPGRASLECGLFPFDTNCILTLCLLFMAGKHSHTKELSGEFSEAFERIKSIPERGWTDFTSERVAAAAAKMVRVANFAADFASTLQGMAKMPSAPTGPSKELIDEVVPPSVPSELSSGRAEASPVAELRVKKKNDKVVLETPALADSVLDKKRSAPSSSTSKPSVKKPKPNVPGFFDNVQFSYKKDSPLVNDRMSCADLVSQVKMSARPISDFTKLRCSDQYQEFAQSIFRVMLLLLSG